MSANLLPWLAIGKMLGGRNVLRDVLGWIPLPVLMWRSANWEPPIHVMVQVLRWAGIPVGWLESVQMWLAVRGDQLRPGLFSVFLVLVRIWSSSCVVRYRAITVMPWLALLYIEVGGNGWRFFAILVVRVVAAGILRRIGLIGAWHFEVGASDILLLLGSIAIIPFRVIFGYPERSDRVRVVIEDRVEVIQVSPVVNNGVATARRL